ncbi:MAG: Protein QmcA [Chlamydiae bacterium]|nr:Protein QmcA [Chlamydiota bacterium]
MGFIVNEGFWAVRECLGKFTEILEPGFHSYIPYVYTTKSLESWGNAAHKKSYLIPKTEQYIHTLASRFQTKENLTINARSSIGWKILDPKKAAYSIDNLPKTISDLAQNLLRDQLGKIAFKELSSSRSEMSQKVHNELSGLIENWGVKLTRYEIQEITYSASIEKLIFKQMSRI